MANTQLKKKKPRSRFRCQQCAHIETRWLGRCPQCSEWNSLVEEVVETRGRSQISKPTDSGEPISIVEVPEADTRDRLSTQVAEFDRVLGGGLVAGSLVLLGGAPGIGKSTLLAAALQGACAGIDESSADHPKGRAVLYVSGEESVVQTAMRARRIGAMHPRLSLLAENSIERILSAAEKLRPAVLAVDSIQTMHTHTLDSIPGSVSQVRECAARLLGFAKSTGIPTILVGHVTKDGSIAGPKTLEHVVDAVLQFEGEGGSPYRVLRALKNRFGSTQEIGVFEMRSSGLREVSNPSELFLAERPKGAPGSVVVASAEGSRPILVEVQALVAPPSAGVGRRTAAGVDGNRVSLLLAVLAQRAGCDVLSRDVFVNAAGGVKLAEPAIDLGIACAIASSGRGRAVDPGTLVFGEIGLAGEVRAVTLPEVRLAEASKLGFTRCILPEQNRARLESAAGLELCGVKTLHAALDLL